MSQEKIRLGFVGCGRISAKHFDALEHHKDSIEIIAVCDSDNAKLDIATQRTGAKGYTDLSKMLANEKLDLVTVATPNAYHPEHVMQAANAGCHVITEKPMAIKWEDGLRMKEVCEQKGVELFIIHQNRFNDPVMHVRKAIEEGRFGKIYMITSNVFWQRPQEYYDKEGSWHGTKEIDGGAFVTQASHYVDLMHLIAGSTPKKLYANLSTLARDIETEDTGSALIEWENGTMGSINVTVLTYPKNMEGSVTIIGEKGTAKIGGVAMNEIEHWDFADDRPEDNDIMNANYHTSSVYGFGHVRNYENIINVLKGKEKSNIDSNEGLASLELLCAILESNEKDAPVSLPYSRGKDDYELLSA